MKAWDLAHIITHYVNEKGDSVSHKKLQKLLYFVEAWHLVHFGESIVDEEFEAWVHGPVIPEVYRKLKGAGFNNIEVTAEDFDTVEEEINSIIERNHLSSDQLDLVGSVLDKYGPLSSMELELLTHNEDPWIKARSGLGPHEASNTVMTKKRIKEYYSAQI